MSYSKQNFRSGDTLYASQLNAMDDEIAVLEAEVESTKNMVGSPLTASTAAGMTDQTKIYVYTGNETGYTAGHWYYHNGTAWTDGGVYNSVAVNTDTSLTVSGQAADSKAVGDAIDDLDSDLTDVKSDLRELKTESLTGVCPVDFLGDFERGSLASSGVKSSTEYLYRVRTAGNIVIASQTTLTCATGFKALIYTFDANWTKISDSWLNSGHTRTLNAGDRIRLLITRNTEDTSEVADIQVFCNALTFPNPREEAQGNAVTALETSVSNLETSVESSEDDLDRVKTCLNIREIQGTNTGLNYRLDNSGLTSANSSYVLYKFDVTQTSHLAVRTTVPQHSVTYPIVSFFSIEASNVSTVSDLSASNNVGHGEIHPAGAQETIGEMVTVPTGAKTAIVHIMSSLGTPPDVTAYSILGLDEAANAYKTDKNANTKIRSYGNSLMTGAVYPNGTYSHLADYADAPYGCVARALGAIKNNVNHTMIGSTGLIYDAGRGSFAANILAENDFDEYDYLLTQMHQDDMANANVGIGSLVSTAGDGTIAGTVLQIIDHINSVGCKFILVSIPPVSYRGYDTFDHVFDNGASIRELDALMHGLAEKYHFIYLDWQGLEMFYHYSDFTYSSNIHPANDRTYRLMGVYLGTCIGAIFNRHPEQNRIDALQNAVVDNVFPINYLAHFANGSLGSEGNFLKNGYANVIATPDIVNIADTITVTMASGYKSLVYNFDAGGTKTADAWLNSGNSRTLQPGERVKILIRKNTDVQEVADIVSYCAQMTYVNPRDLTDAVTNIQRKGLPQLSSKIFNVATIDGYYVNRNGGGSLSAGASFCVTDFIPVTETNKYYVDGLKIVNNTCIAGYDTAFEFVSLIYRNPDTSSSVPVTAQQITIPAGVAYIRATGTANKPVNIYRMSDTDDQGTALSAMTDRVIGASIVYVDRSEFAAGYINSWGADSEIIVSGSANYKYTGHIRVDGGRTILVRNLYTLGSGCQIIYYDGNKRVINRFTNSSAANTTVDRTVTLPANACYIRYNIETGNEAITGVYYQDAPTAPLDVKYPASYIHKWIDGTFAKTQIPFASALSQSSGGIITVIDDDTLNEAHVRLFHELCTNNDIVGTYAVETYYVEQANMGALLRQYEQEGFHCAFHCRTQEPYYRVEPEYRNFAQAQANFVDGMYHMHQLGFLNPNFWVTPYGVSDADMQSLARKWGMECLVSIGYKTYEGFDTTARGRYCLARVGFNQTDSGTATFADLKAVIDGAASSNGWVLVGTHVYEWDSDVGYSRFAEMVTYAKNKGLTFKTLNEAWRIRKPIYDFYEHF